MHNTVSYWSAGLDDNLYKLSMSLTIDVHTILKLSQITDGEGLQINKIWSLMSKTGNGIGINSLIGYILSIETQRYKQNSSKAENTNWFSSCIVIWGVCYK